MKDVKIFGSIVEDEARQQIEKLANYEPYKDAKIRICRTVGQSEMDRLSHPLRLRHHGADSGM